jgi:hypothetical protein
VLSVTSFHCSSLLSVLSQAVLTTSYPSLPKLKTVGTVRCFPHPSPLMRSTITSTALLGSPGCLPLTAARHHMLSIHNSEQMMAPTTQPCVRLLCHFFIVSDSRLEWCTVVSSKDCGAEVSWIETYTAKSQWGYFFVQRLGNS